MIYKPSKFDAIKSLHPNAEWFWTGTEYDGLNWISQDIQKPSEEEIETELSRLMQVYNANQYARLRSAEYPSIESLIVALWESVVEGRETSVHALEQIRQTIKEKYPK
jgi:hypothetical protein